MAQKARLDLLINVTTQGLEELTKLEKTARRLEEIRAFRRLQQDLTKTEAELRQAEQEFAKLQKQLKETATPTQELRKAVEQAGQRVQLLRERASGLQSSLGKLSASLKAAKISTQDLAKAERLLVQETQRLQRSLTQTRALDAYKRMFDVKPISQVRAELSRLQKAYKQLELGYKRGKVSALELAAAKAKLKERTKELSSSFIRLDSTQKQLVGTISALVGAYVSLQGAMALKAHVEESIRVFQQFDDEIRRVAAVSRATAEDFRRLQETAREMGRNTRYSATEAAEGMRYLAMAGLNVDQTIATIPTVLNLATVGMMDLGQAADIVTNIMTQFGASIEELPTLADYLTAAVTQSNTNLMELGYAFSYAGPVARAAGQSFRETTAVLMGLANAGYKGERAGTTLRQAITRLIKPTAEAREVLDRYGVAVRDASGNMRPLIDILIDLNRAGIVAEDTIRLFGMIAGPGMAALISQGEDTLLSYREKLENVAGTTQKVAQFQEQGLGGALRRIRALWEEYQITLGEAIAQDGVLVRSLQDLANWLARNSHEIGQLIVKLSHYAAAFIDALKAAGDFVVTHQRLITTFAEYGAKIFLLVQAWKLYNKTMLMVKGAQVAAELMQVNSAVLVLTRSLKALRAAVPELLAVWALFEFGKTVKDVYDLEMAFRKEDQAMRQGAEAALLLRANLDQLSQQTGFSIENIKQLNQLVSNGAFIWDEAGQRWVAAVQNAQGAVVTLTQLQQQLNTYLQEQRSYYEQQATDLEKSLVKEQEVFNKRFELYQLDAANFRGYIELRSTLIDGELQKTLAAIEKYKANSAQAEFYILQTKQQAWQQALQAYQTTISGLIQEEERRKQAVLLIEQEIQRARLSTDQFIRELRRQEMSEVEAYRDRVAEAEEYIARMRKALAEGNLQEARKYYDYSLQAIRQISSGVQDEALKHEARNKQIELAQQLQQEYVSALEKEKQAHQAVAQEAASAREAISQKIEEIKQKIAELSQQRQEIKIDIKLETEATKARFQQLKQELEAQFGQIKAAVQLYDEAARQKAQVLKQDLETLYEENPIRAALALGGEQVYEDAAATKQRLEEFFNTAPIYAKTALDTQQALTEATQVKEQLSQALTVQGKASLDTTPIFAATNQARDYVSSQLNSLQTASQHTVYHNALEAQQAVFSLEGITTHSTHIIHVRRVEEFASGGMPLDTFRRRQGKLPGWGTKDTVPAMLMPGEFVIRKEAVRYYGPQLLYALNWKKIPRDLLPHFAEGGFVSQDIRLMLQQLKELAKKLPKHYFVHNRRPFVPPTSPEPKAFAKPSAQEYGELSRLSTQFAFLFGHKSVFSMEKPTKVVEDALGRKWPIQATYEAVVPAPVFTKLASYIMSTPYIVLEPLQFVPRVYAAADVMFRNLSKAMNQLAPGLRKWWWTDYGTSERFAPAFMAGAKHLAGTPFVLSVDLAQQLYPVLAKRVQDLKEKVEELELKLKFTPIGTVPTTAQAKQIAELNKAKKDYQQAQAQLNRLVQHWGAVVNWSKHGFFTLQPTKLELIAKMLSKPLPYDSPWKLYANLSPTYEKPELLHRSAKMHYDLIRNVTGELEQVTKARTFEGVRAATEKFIKQVRDGLPHYAKGGLVPKDTLAFVHKGEFVLPPKGVAALGLSVLYRFAEGGLVPDLPPWVVDIAEKAKAVTVQVQTSVGEAVTRLPTLGRVELKIGEKELPIYAAPDVAQELVQQLEKLAEVI